MFKNEYILSVDIKKTMNAVIPTFVQYDNATLLFEIYDDGKPYDLTAFTSAEVTHKRPDGTVITGTATLENLSNGVKGIRYTYSGNEMAVPGFVSTSLSLYSSGKKVTIQPFKVEIVIDANEDSIVSAPEYGILQQLLTTVDQSIQGVANLHSVGVFSQSALYLKNNIVTSDGSSWIALANTQNNPLPTLPTTQNTWWRLLAQKGTDSGQGQQSIADASTTVKGIVQLNNTLTSTSITTALTAAQGKVINDNLLTHTGNANIHVTTANKSDWNAKETTAGSQAKVNVHAETVATTSTLGHVKPDGTTITVDSNGVITAISGVGSGTGGGTGGGVGTVTKVNNVTPDTNGNVTLNAQHISATPADHLLDITKKHIEIVDTIPTDLQGKGVFFTKVGISSNVPEGTGGLQESFTTHIAEHASTVQRGHVMLSNDTNSTSETLAPTMKALNEVKSYANDIKTKWADIIGSPLMPTDTQDQLVAKTQAIKNTLAEDLTNMGQASVGTETLTALISKIKNIITEEGTIPDGVATLEEHLAEIINVVLNYVEGTDLTEYESSMRMINEFIFFNYLMLAELNIDTTIKDDITDRLFEVVLYGSMLDQMNDRYQENEYHMVSGDTISSALAVVFQAINLIVNIMTRFPFTPGGGSEEKYIKDEVHAADHYLFQMALIFLQRSKDLNPSEFESRKGSYLISIDRLFNINNRVNYDEIMFEETLKSINSLYPYYPELYKKYVGLVDEVRQEEYLRIVSMIDTDDDMYEFYTQLLTDHIDTISAESTLLSMSNRLIIEKGNSKKAYTPVYADVLEYLVYYGSFIMMLEAFPYYENGELFYTKRGNPVFITKEFSGEFGCFELTSFGGILIGYNPYATAEDAVHDFANSIGDSFLVASIDSMWSNTVLPDSFYQYFNVDSLNETPMPETEEYYLENNVLLDIDEMYGEHKELISYFYLLIGHPLLKDEQERVVLSKRGNPILVNELREVVVFIEVDRNGGILIAEKIPQNIPLVDLYFYNGDYTYVSHLEGLTDYILLPESFYDYFEVPKGIYEFGEETDTINPNFDIITGVISEEGLVTTIYESHLSRLLNALFTTLNDVMYNKSLNHFSIPLNELSDILESRDDTALLKKENEAAISRFLEVLGIGGAEMTYKYITHSSYTLENNDSIFKGELSLSARFKITKAGTYTGMLKIRLKAYYMGEEENVTHTSITVATWLSYSVDEPYAFHQQELKFNQWTTIAIPLIVDYSDEAEVYEVGIRFLANEDIGITIEESEYLDTNENYYYPSPSIQFWLKGAGIEDMEDDRPPVPT